MGARSVIALVTGAAGFVGSTLVDRLLADGHDVRGVDWFTEYYDPLAKVANLAESIKVKRFSLMRADLRSADLAELLDAVDVVFHLSAQPGVRRSWEEFEVYVHDNVLVTHRLLEAARSATSLERFVYASSSSVYGNAATYPTRETDPARPHSPYGVTKLAAEDLCSSYAVNWMVPTVSLRYFTVYGPRQRPDMAFHRMCDAVVTGSTFPLYGDGSARRNFTFVDDVVEATRLAGTVDLEPGTVINVAGTTDATMAEVITLIGELAGSPLQLRVEADQPGDVRRTGGCIDRARDLLGWNPVIDLRHGLARQLAWHRSRR